MLDPEFVAVVRPHLRHLRSDAELHADLALRALGLDSINSVALMLDLEERFDINLPNALLTAETFATAGSLWATLESVRQSSAGAAPHPSQHSADAG